MLARIVLPNRVCLNTQSNTTRIETSCQMLGFSVTAMGLNTQSNTTRIETSGAATDAAMALAFEYPIQYNKD